VIGETPVTYRIHRSLRENDVILALSGDLDENYAVEVEALVATEAEHHVVLDLSEVTLVDRDAVRFLARIESEGAVLVNCPEYVRSWIISEQRGQSKEAI
jgi:anti-anti-sigma regulatory factor